MMFFRLKMNKITTKFLTKNTLILSWSLQKIVRKNTIFPSDDILWQIFWNFIILPVYIVYSQYTSCAVMFLKILHDFPISVFLSLPPSLLLYTLKYCYWSYGHAYCYQITSIIYLHINEILICECLYLFNILTNQYSVSWWILWTTNLLVSNNSVICQ